MSLNKTFNLVNAWKLEFRAEAFNISNTVNYAQPNSTLGTPTFGEITSTSFNYTPRVFQFALRVAY